MERSRNPLAGTGKVFRFTLRQLLCKKGWLISTFLIGGLMLIGIPLLIWGVSAASSDDGDDSDSPLIASVFVCDETDGTADYNLLKEFGYPDADYTAYDSTDAAIDAVTDANTTLILRVTKQDGTYLLNVLLPDGSVLSRSDADSFAGFVQANFKTLLLEKAQLSPEAAALLSVQISTSASELKPDAAEDEESDAMKMIVGFVVPFLMLMLMYMMVLLYGQSMANTVMLEKNSKLMETILTAVHPVALMTGKLFATASAAVLQILIWLACLLSGIFGGTFFALQMIPETQNETVQTVNMIAENSRSIFSLSGILMTVVIFAVGFLLYLCLGAISGAMASKAEDLGKTNYIFMIVILISFFLSLSFPSADTPDSDLSFVSEAAWVRYFPFTAVFVVPGKLITGELGILPACGTVVCMLIGTALLIWLASTVYRGLVLYRGQTPNPKTLIRILRENAGSKKKSG